MTRDRAAVKAAAAMFRTEADLCDALTVAAGVDGWDVYPETGGFDLLLVWSGRAVVPHPRWQDPPEPTPPGVQVGVDAKLRANVDVLEQAAGRMDCRHRPDVGAVLVPTATGPFLAVARRLGLRVLTVAHCLRDQSRARIIPYIPELPRPYGDYIGRLALPPVPLHGSGGGPAPRVLSPWRVAALRLCARLAVASRLTSADFRAAKVDSRRWVAMGWLARADRGVFVAGPALGKDGPVIGYEREAAALSAVDGVADRCAQGRT